MRATLSSPAAAVWRRAVWLGESEAGMPGADEDAIVAGGAHRASAGVSTRRGSPRARASGAADGALPGAPR
jgi:hypothetical protein